MNICKNVISFMICGMLQLLCNNVATCEAQSVFLELFSCQNDDVSSSQIECLLRNTMHRSSSGVCREKCALIPAVAKLFGWICGPCGSAFPPPIRSPVTTDAPVKTPILGPIRAPVNAPEMTPVRLPAQPPTLQPPTATVGISKCGGAVNTGGGSANTTCLNDLWNPTQNRNMHCYAYGGTSDPCALHNNNDVNDGLFKSPSKCDRDTFYLWDEPDTQGKSYTWAGQEWLNYANRYSLDILRLRQRGVMFTSPMLRAGEPGVTASNLNQFYTACGAPCRDRNSSAYININAVNVFVGPWNVAGIQGCRDAANYMRNEINAYYPTDNLPWYITNWSRLGTYNISDQVDAMSVINLFFQSGSPIQRIYWFGATDYGGNSGNNFLTQRISNGQTLGQTWRLNCDAL